MRKLLPIMLLTVLFIACSSDDDNTDPNNGNQNGNNMIDEKIIGKWKVEYSKTIKGAWLKDDGTLEIAKDAIITEYDGKTTSLIASYIFSDWERVIEFTNNNELFVYDIGDKGILINKDNSAAKYSVYEIKSNIIEWKYDRGMIPIAREYKLENGELIIEIKPTPLTNYTYAISRYSKITE